MTRRKNVKRIDPRYFLHETVNRDVDGSALDEVDGTDPDYEMTDRDRAYFAALDARREKDRLPTTFPPQALEDKGLQQWWPAAGKRPPKASPGEASDNNGIVFAVADGPAYFYGRGTAGSLWGLGYKDTGFWMPFE